MNTINIKGFGVIIDTLKIIWASSKSWTIWRFVVSVANGILPLGTLYLIKKIVDEIVSMSGNDGGEMNFEFFSLYIGIWIFLLLVITLLTLLHKYISEIHNHKLSDHIQGLIQDKALSVQFRYYDSDNYHDVFYRAQKESKQKPQRLLNDLSQLISNGTSLAILSTVIFLTLHWLIGVLFVVVAIPTALVQFKYIGRYLNWSIKTTQIERKASYVTQVMTDKIYAAEGRIFLMGEELRKIFINAKLELLNGRLKILNIFLKSTIGTSLVELTFLGIAFLYIIMQTNKGVLSIGSLVMCFQAFQRGQKVLKDVLVNVNQIYEQKLFLSQLFEYLNLKVAIEDNNATKKIECNFENLEVKNLSFSYPDRDFNVIKQVDFSVRKGEILAIVGENGSGKSTLVKLLCGFYSVSKGDISIDGNSIQDWNLDEYRQNVSVLFQDFNRYNFSVGFNVTTRESDWDKERLGNSLKLAGVDQVVNDLPKGYRTKLGRIFKGNTELSTGQYQRLALSRAIYKPSSVLILDEPTSFIDGISEQKFLDQLREITQDKITIMVSHKLSNIILADKICVMKNGEMIEFGTHQELVRKDSHYKKIFRSQLISIDD